MALRDIKRRFLLFLCFSCCITGLQPATTGPPKRDDRKGQPEFQQPLDNQPEISRYNKMPHDVRYYPFDVSYKTAALLAETLSMIEYIWRVRDNVWLNKFFDRLVQFAIKKPSADAPVVIQRASNSQGDTTALPGQLESTLTTVASLLTSSKPDEIITSAPKLVQRVDGALSKEEISDQNNNYAETIAPNQEDDEIDDELVRELNAESQLYHKMITLNETIPKVKQESSSSTNEPEPEPITEAATEKNDVNDNNPQSKVKKEIKAKILDDITELKRLGGTREEILRALHLEDQNLVDFTNPNFLEQNHKSKEEGNEFEITTNDQDEEEAVNEINKEDALINSAPPQLWKPRMDATQPRNPLSQRIMGQIPKPQMQQQYPPPVNRQYQHMNLDHFRNAYNYYRPGLNVYRYPNMNQPRPVFNNFGPQNHMLHNINEGRPIQQPFRFPQVLEPNKLPQIVNDQRNDHPTFQRYHQLPTQNMRNYPDYIQNNATLQMKPSYLPNASFSINSGKQLSDEMERQLRAGKVIILSDSLVRSNFDDTTQKTDEDTQSKTTNLPAIADDASRTNQTQN